jgi:UDP-N-acetylglucosamine-lysosomal-enzyme
MLFVLGSVQCRAYSCYIEGHCDINWKKNKLCEAECANQMCEFDQGSVTPSSPAHDRMMSSDCIYECLIHCSSTLLANDVCDSECNSVQCGFDAGVCGFCDSGCEL